MVLDLVILSKISDFNLVDEKNIIGRKDPTKDNQLDFLTEISYQSDGYPVPMS